MPAIICWPAIWRWRGARLCLHQLGRRVWRHGVRPGICTRYAVPPGLDKTAIVLCDVYHEERERTRGGGTTHHLATTDRARRRARLCGHGRLQSWNSTCSRIPVKLRLTSSICDLAPFGGYIEDYHIFQGTKAEPVIGAIRRHLETRRVRASFRTRVGAGPA